MTFTGSPRLASSRVRGRSGGRGRRRLGRAHRVRDRQPDRGRRRRCRDLAVQRRSGLVTGGGAPTRSPPRSATSNGFASPRKLTGYSGPCLPRLPIRRPRPARPALKARSPLSPLGTRRSGRPRLHPPRLSRPLPAHQARIGKQRGAKVAQIDLARRLAEAIWHMLSRGEAFAPKGATDPLAA